MTGGNDMATTTTQAGRTLSLSTTLAYDHLLIQNFRYNEGLSQLFSLEINILHDDGEDCDEPTWIEPVELVGKPMCVTAEQKDGAKRFFNGICSRFTLSHYDKRFSLYSAEIVPQLWLLTQTFQSRIFQNKSVEEILRKVFEGFLVKYEISNLTDKRNYCVQYRETDWDFASRLMEEEGIFYYFEHTEDNHTLVLGNTPQSHPELPTKPQIIYRKTESAYDNDWTGAVTRWDSENNLRTGKYTVWDNNFQLPKKHLEADEPSQFNIGGNQKLKFYDYPGGHAKLFDGISAGGGEQAGELSKVFQTATQTVKVRQQEIDVGYKLVRAEADTCAVTAGYRFELTNYYDNNNVEGSYVIVTTEHVGEQSPDYFSNEESSAGYRVKMVCIPHQQAPYRPRRRVERPTIPGSQTAIVVGPSGEEIHVDKYGRIKVQFNWDRDGKLDDDSSCWIRVVQPWAGNNWGTMFIPRIGMEVLVAFLDGDPDQPIITGCVYNPHAMPPYELPANKTRSTIKSNSSTGGGGFNEIRFEDKKGEEQIFIHGERNMDVRVKESTYQFIGKEQHSEVGTDGFAKVGGDQHSEVAGNVTEKVGGSVEVQVGGDVQEKISGKQAVDAGTEIHLKAGMKVIIEAGVQITLKGAGGFIDIGPSGVTIQGTLVNINSGGAAGSGSGASPGSPTAPTAADKADAGKEAAKGSAPPPPPAGAGAAAGALNSGAQSGAPLADPGAGGAAGGGAGAGQPPEGGYHSGYTGGMVGEDAKIGGGTGGYSGGDSGGGAAGQSDGDIPPAGGHSGADGGGDTGSGSWYEDDGTKVTDHPDGTQTQEKPDGSKTTVNEDGSAYTQYPDGSQTVWPSTVPGDFRVNRPPPDAGASSGDGGRAAGDMPGMYTSNDSGETWKDGQGRPIVPPPDIADSDE